MLNRTDSGLVALSLLFLPLSTDAPSHLAVLMDPRWLIRVLVNGFFCHKIIKILWQARGSPASFYPSLRAFGFTVISAILLTASSQEISLHAWDLDSYHHSLFWTTGLALAVVYCVRLLLVVTVSTPGPFLARFTSLWKVYHLCSGTYGQTIIKLHKKHGNVVRVGPYEYSIGSFETFFPAVHRLPHLLWGVFIGDIVEFIFGTLKNPGHICPDLKTMVRQASDYESEIDACNEVLLNALTQYADGEQTIQLGKLISCYAWDMMGATTVGQSFGFMDMKEDVTTIINRIESWRLFAILYGTFLRFHPWITQLLRVTGWRSGGKNYTTAMLNQIVQTRLKPRFLVKDDPEISTAELPGRNKSVWDIMRDRSTFLSHFDGPEYNDNTDMPQFAIALMLVGSDPIARHIHSTLYYLGCNDNIVQKLRCELEGLDPAISSPPTLQELMNRKYDLPFLHSVLRESYRLKEVDGINFSRSAFSSNGEEVFFEGHRIPRQCTVRLSAEAANRDPKLGEAPDEFIPDLWDDSESKKAFAFGRTEGTGPAAIQRALVAKIVLQIVQKFNITLSDPALPGSAINMNYAKAHFTIVPNLKRQSTAAGIHVDSPMADHVGFIRRHMGARCVSIMLEARGCNDEVASTKYATLIGLKSEPLLENHQRRPLHEAIRAVSKGALESQTDLTTHRVVIGPKGCSGYRPPDNQNRYTNGDGGRGRGRGRGRDGGRGRGRDRGRGRGRGGRGDSYGGGPSDSQSISESSSASTLVGHRLREQSAVTNDSLAGARRSGWSDWSTTIAEKDRADNEAAAKRINEMVEDQKAKGIIPVETFKKTCIINGKRTTVDVFKNGESINGGISVQQPEPEKPRGPLVIPEGYIPPHKRVLVTVKNDPEDVGLKEGIKKQGEGVVLKKEKDAESKSSQNASNTDTSEDVKVYNGRRDVAPKERKDTDSRAFSPVATVFKPTMVE